MPPLLDSGFKWINCEVSFEGTGRIPFNPLKIMGMNNHFNKLEPDQKKHLMNELIPKVVIEVELHARLSEDFMSELLNSVFSDIDNCPEKHGMSLNEMVTSRQRAM